MESIKKKKRNFYEIKFSSLVNFQFCMSKNSDVVGSAAVFTDMLQP